MSDYKVSRFVFQYTLQVEDGDWQTYYVTTHGFRTGPSDTPANYHIEERVESAGSVKRGLFSGARVAGASSPSYGVTTLVNTDGGLDTFVKYASGGYVTCYYGDDSMAFPDDYFVVYTTKVFSVVADFEKVTVRYQDRISDLDKPIVTALFKATGGLEGYEGITARKPICFGMPGLMPLILVNKEFQVYSVHWNAVDAVQKAGTDPFATVFEGGVPVDRDKDYLIASDLLYESTKPSPGHYKMWFGYGGLNPGGGFFSQAASDAWDYGPVFLRLGTPPTNELRFGMRGFLRNRNDDAVRPWRFSDLCNRAGMEDVTPETLGSVNGNVEDFDAGNHYIDDDRTYLTVMNDRAQALLGFFGFNRLGQFYCGRLLGPEDGTDASLYTFTFENSSDFLREPIEGMESPAWQVTVNAGATRPMTPLTGASAEMTDLVSRDPWYVTFTGTSTDVQELFPGAKVVSLDIQGNDFTTEESREEFVDRFASLYGKQRDFVSLTTQEFTTETLSLDLHDKVTLQVPRFGYDAGTLFRIVDIETNLDNKEIRFSLWGNSSDAQRWTIGGGGYPAGAGEPGSSNGGDGSTPPPGSVPPVLPPGGGSTSLSDPSRTQTLLAPLVQEMFCVETSPATVMSYTMDDLAQIIKVQTDGDPGFYNTIDLHHFQSLSDSSGTSGAMTLFNGAALSSAQSKFGGSSILVDGTNDYGVIPFVQDHRLLASDFALSFFFYVPSGVTATVGRTLISLGSSTAWGLIIQQTSDNRIELLGTTNGSSPVGGTTRTGTFTRDAWHWFLAHRISNAIRLFLDGVTTATFTGFASGVAMYDFSAGIGVGATTDGVLGSSGTKTSIYIDEFRILKGLHPYPNSGAALTVPTAQHEL